jgi:Caspase domain
MLFRPQTLVSMRFVISAFLILLSLCSLGRSEDNPAMFALLVGINDYAQPLDQKLRINPLKGPGNDVVLMKDLLVTQFGFKDDGSHILTLTGASATHQAIIDGIRGQLIENAKKSSGATVLFYFSGHGSQALDTQGITGTRFHQTLVAYDSRREGGSDILDDEVNNQLEELRRFTDRITLIFDSCHSGSVWKDISTLTSKSLPPNPFSSSGSTETFASVKDVGGTIKPMGGDYSVIVAATADQTGVEDQVPTKDGPQFHGLLTFYLDKIVRASGNLTYDQIAKRAAVQIAARAPSQHPQAEGDINRFFLGRSGDRIAPHIHVVAISDPTTFTIDAGAADGLQTGALLALYGRDTTDLSGDTGRIANARVVKISDFKSVANLSGTAKTPITTDAKVKVITPFPADGGTSVHLPTLMDSGEPQVSQAVDFLSKLKQRISNSTLLKIVADPHQAKVVVRWECQDNAEQKNIGRQEFLVQPTGDVCHSGYKFELVPPDQHYVLFDLRVAAEGDPEKLAEAIEARAKQENLRNLTNNVSSIRSVKPAASPLTIELENLDVTINNAIPTITSKGFSTSQITPIKIRNYFRFRITNNSENELFIAVVWIGSGGGIGLYTPTNTGERLSPGEAMTTRPPLTAGPPEGLETYKVIATTKPGVDFRVLEQPGVTRDAVSAPLEWLLSQTGNTKTRDPTVASDLDVGDWITVQRDTFVLH